MKSHDSYSVHFFKYLTRYVLQTCYVDENHHFLTYLARNPAKIPCFYDFLAKDWFLLIGMYIFNASKFLRERWLYYVTVTSYEVQWYSFWFQWIEEVHTYTLVANIGVSCFLYRKSRGVSTSPLGGRVTKNTLGGWGLKRFWKKKNFLAFSPKKKSSIHKSDDLNRFLFEFPL